MISSLAVFALTIAGIIWRPRRLSEALTASLGAVAMIAVGGLSVGEAINALEINLNVLGFFLGLMIVAAIAESSGLFEAITEKAVVLSRGSGRRLLLIVFGIGVVITTLLSNDATALMLTPVVFLLVRRLRIDPLPYVFACAFIANAASFLLPVANPVNLLAVDAFHLRLGDYLAHLLLPSLAVIGVTVGVFLYLFRKEIPASFTLATLPTRAVSRNLDRHVILILALIAVGYIIFSFNGWPLSVPVLAGALALLAITSIRRIKLTQIFRSVSWSILPFVAGLAVLVQGLENSGVTQYIGELFTGLLNHGQLPGALATSIGTAAGSNLMNNWPMMMVSVTTLSGIPDAVAANPGLPYQAIIGAALGPNIAVLGSLSSMLWLLILRRRGLNVTAGSFLKLGLLVTPVALLCGSLVLYLLS
ncbi:ArsB/NhaD family transporter [Dehalogenimonas etheniformans]|uniref:Arsenic transporter n=1 Tax=Dehalogenimonas etheniformans TaxID=1536648 RepID=A0A2P5P934_9CHLR|nr:ArsB/NhaD family transporter [Dehalogenimonas etheniformans]PPD58796.1 arsenic transporter [Dehalogenimonas etheniformans]QNT76434.1 arsenic transporter [Dehalogenimonas etheniformans]